MPYTPSESSPGSWLGRALANKRLEIAELLGKLRGIGAQNTSHTEKLQNLATILDQISDEKDKEEKIIRRIESIEEEHRQRRVNHTLDEIKPTPEMLNAHAAEDIEQQPKPRNGLLWLMALLALFGRPKKDFNHK